MDNKEKKKSSAANAGRNTESAEPMSYMNQMAEENGGGACAAAAINVLTGKDKMRSYRKHPGSFILLLLVILAAVITVAVLVFLIGYILINGIPHLSLSMFEWEYTTENVSMMPAIINTITMVAVSLVIAVPLGLFSAIYLVEYAGRGNKLVKVIRVTAETLAGIPSIVFGLFGSLMFGVSLHFGYSMLSGALTLAIMVLPTILRTSEEALKSVSDSYREGSFGLGAGRLRTVFRIVLPSAIPGILAGIILAIGRICGETAALIYTSGTVAGIPDSTSGFRAYACNPHVRVVFGRPLHGGSECDRRRTARHGNPDQRPLRVCCAQIRQ